MKFFIVFMCLLVNILARIGFGPNDQDWGYVTVRDRAHMFWWLHYTTALEDYIQRPLVIWLQGGPGGSSTGIGNFHEIGPWDVNQQERDLSWTKFLNVLFVDNPVGTGFSYVDNANDTSLFAANNTIISQDFITLLKGFLDEKPEFGQVPLYIFGQSYGGKMAADIALLLDNQIKAGNINCTLKGIGLGDAWISPIDSLTSWPSYLLNLGFIDTEGFEILKNLCDLAKGEIDEGVYDRATTYFHAMQTVINSLTSVNFYNVLEETPQAYAVKSNLRQQENIEDTINLLQKLNLDYKIINLKGSHEMEIKNYEYYGTVLENLMKGPVASSLNLSDIPITWGDQSEFVFRAVDLDFMKPVTEVIETILNTTDIEVIVYNGQLDLIVDTPGTLSWVNKLQWPGAQKWKEANRTGIIVDGVNEGFAKSYESFKFYWINRAGHSVPTDNPHTMEYVLREVTSNYSNSIR